MARPGSTACSTPLLGALRMRGEQLPAPGAATCLKGAAAPERPLGVIAPRRRSGELVCTGSALQRAVERPERVPEPPPG